MSHHCSSLHSAFVSAIRARRAGSSFSYLAPRSYWEHIFTSLGGGQAHYHTLNVGKGHYSGDINDGGVVTADDDWKFQNSKENPVGGLDTNTIIMLGMGSALLGAIVYAIYQIGQTQNALNDTNAQIAQGASSAQSVSDQIAAASQSAQNVSDQIYNANQTVQSIQQSPAYQTANQGASWWNDL